ncbi:MAG: class I SAM-dependent methyltransferase [Candidatus Binatia bacterium]
MTEAAPPRPLAASPPEEAWSEEWVRRFLRCKRCAGVALGRDAGAVSCRTCGHAMPLVGPGLLEDLPEGSGQSSAATPPPGSLEDVARRVRAFYEQNPFPNYDGYESVGDLLARASRSVYAAALDRQIPVGARVLEVGCGTGQLGAFLSVGGRSVVGVDMTRASLELAGGFKQRHGLKNCNFVHGDLFDLPLQPESFDLVICKGVLMATGDARGGLHAICKFLRPGGYLIIGLYNRIGRLPTTLRRIYFRLTKADPRKVDYVMRKMARSDQKLRSWYLDQYAHPHETRHTVDQVLGWFDEEGVEFTAAAPPIRVGEPFDFARPLFSPSPRGSRLEHWLVQLWWIYTISHEGALFDLIGRKRLRDSSPDQRG